jgi:hypothetical protein
VRIQWEKRQTTTFDAGKLIPQLKQESAQLLDVAFFTSAFTSQLARNLAFAGH